MEELAQSNEQSFSFEETLSRLEAETRLDPAVARTADYLVAASMLDDQKDVLQEACDKLKSENPREIYFKFLKDSVNNLKTTEKSRQYKLIKQINNVAIMGLGIWQEDLGLTSSGKQALKISGEPKWDIIKNHIGETVFGNYFIEELSVPSDTTLWGNDFPLRMSSCDASQHRFKLRVPFNKTWATPVVVNNSAGTIKERQGSEPKWKHVSVPKDTREYEDWVILGPDDYSEMDDGDYEWAAKSSMDVGQFFVEETFIFKHGGMTLKPDVHFRDGRIFPQDHLMNCTIQNRHGQLTREATFRMANTCETAKKLNMLYCGVAKQVNLKVYSTIINWYITHIMGKTEWNPTGQVISDSEMMRNVLYNNDFKANTFAKINISCPILRRYETASNLNRRTRKQVQNDLDRLSKVFHSRGLTAREIVEQALKVNVVMFFAGHSPTDELYIPRYEFSTLDSTISEQVKPTILKILSALRLASFDVDQDHLRGLDEPINTLVPTPILVAHDISKKMGDELASNFAQKATAEFLRRMRAKKGTL